MAKRAMIRKNFILPADLWGSLEDEAQAKEKSISEIIRDAIREHLKKGARVDEKPTNK